MNVPMTHQQVLDRIEVARRLGGSALLTGANPVVEQAPV